ncbi:MAG TPA: RnfH family protein [Burkholderiaceae bacterium]|nr:RnfH family protein [Burkholderiaceae bacterium]
MADENGAVRVLVVRHAGEQVLEQRHVTLAAGSTVADAIVAAGWLPVDPQTVIDAGVFNHARRLDTPLADGDRVEIYRPLRVDPKEARRIRATLKGRRATG